MKPGKGGFQAGEGGTWGDPLHTDREGYTDEDRGHYRSGNKEVL